MRRGERWRERERDRDRDHYHSVLDSRLYHSDLHSRFISRTWIPAISAWTWSFFIQTWTPAFINQTWLDSSLFFIQTFHSRLFSLRLGLLPLLLRPGLSFFPTDSDLSSQSFSIWLVAALPVSLRGSIQCCFTSTETMRLIRDGETRTAISTLTQLMSSVSLGL